MQYRRKAFAYQTRFGQPALFVTLTPNSDNSFTMAHYAGVTTVKSLFDSLEARLLSKSELRQASLGNDCVSTRLFTRVVEAFIKYALGIDPQTKQAMPFRGLFGDVKAYFGMVETQGRGTLHIHFLIWLSGCPTNSTQIENLLLSTEGIKFRESVKAYAESIVSNEIPLGLGTGHCKNCGASYSELIGLEINTRARQDPCAGLFSAKARRKVVEPFMVKCGKCNAKFSSQHVLHQVLVENRQLMPAWVGRLNQSQIKKQAKLESRCRNTLKDAERIVYDREWYHYFMSPEWKLETADMTMREVTYLLEGMNTERMPYCKADQDPFQNDMITRRIEISPPSPMDSRMSRSSLDYMVSVLVVLLNQHWWGHTNSCFKSSRATLHDMECRYLYPRERVEETSFTHSGVQLTRKVGHEFINGFNYALMATFKCNHDIQILLGGTEAVDRIYYACKYVTKQQQRLDSIIPIAVAALKRRQEREKQTGGTSFMDGRVTRSRKRVTSMVYNLTNRQEVAGPLAALYLHTGSCCYSSANCSNLPLADMIRQLCSDGDYQCQLVLETDRCGRGGASASAVSMLDDYIHRPKELESVCVYQYGQKYYRKRCESAKLSRYPFQEGHPLHLTHSIAIRKMDAVPVILGYRIPYITHDMSQEEKLKRAIGSLVLFKPFRALFDLTGNKFPNAENWQDAYSTWEPSRSTFVTEIMGNMDDFSLGRNKAASEAQLHHFEHPNDSDETGSTSSSDESMNEHILFDDSDLSDMETNCDKPSGSENVWGQMDGDESSNILESSDLNPLFCPTCPAESDNTDRIISTFSHCAMLDNIALTTANLAVKNDGGAEFPALSFMKKWAQDSSTDNCIAGAAVKSAEVVRYTNVLEVFEKALESSALRWDPDGALPDSNNQFAKISEISRFFTLNRLQHIAFQKIGLALLQRWKNQEDHDFSNSDIQQKLREDQLLFYLGGEGGTGKSRVIGAVQGLCGSWKRDECLLKTALTGKAATLISGRTLASLLLQLKTSKHETMLGIDVIVIDEVSMMLKSQLVQLDISLRKTKRTPNVPFGGVFIILVGDFLQLPPVGADPLFVKPWSKPKCSATAMVGFELWRKFTDVVMLQESVRFRRDPEWGRGCKFARLGTWTTEFIDIINSRMVQTPEEENQLPSAQNGANCTYVTPENSTRQAINNYFVSTTAAQLPDGHYPIRVVANFKGKLDSLSRSETEMIMRLPDNKLGRMAPFLDLLPGMPIQITQNVRPAKLVANGTLGSLEQILYRPGTMFRLVRDSVSGVIVQLPSVPPLAVIVRIPRGPTAKPMVSDIDADLFPLFYETQAYKPSEISLPRVPSGAARSVSVQPNQFPLVCAVGSTIYKVQGETLDNMVVTEWRSQFAIANKPQQPYLLVSRVTSREAFTTLEPITPEIAAWAHPSTEALEEEERLNRLSDILVAAMTI